MATSLKIVKVREVPPVKCKCGRMMGVHRQICCVCEYGDYDVETLYDVFKAETDAIVQEIRDKVAADKKKREKIIVKNPGHPDVWDAVQEYTGTLKNMTKRED